MMKKELSVWKSETLISSHDYKIAAIASRIISSHNSQSRCGGLSLQEFPLIEWKISPSTPPFRSYWPQLGHISTLQPVTGKRDWGFSDWLGARRLGPGRGVLPSECAAPNLNQTGLLSSKNKSGAATTGPSLRYFIYAGCFERLSMCRHCANVKDEKKT